MNHTRVEAAYKVIVLGDSNSGKTTFVQNYTKRSSRSKGSTIGVEYAKKVVSLPNGQLCTTTIWDTSGSEKYRAITTTHYRKSHGALLFFDLTNRDSFLSLDSWIQAVHDNAEQDTVVLLIGNKADSALRAVHDQEIASWAQSQGFNYFETSATTGQNVKEAFSALIQQIYVQELSKSQILQEQEEKFNKIMLGPKGKSQQCCK